MSTTIILLPSERILIRCGQRHFVIACDQEGDLFVVASHPDSSGREKVIWDGKSVNTTTPPLSSPLHRIPEEKAPEKIETDRSCVIVGRQEREALPEVKKIVPKALPRGRPKKTEEAL